MEFTKRGVVVWGLLLLTVLFAGASSAGEGLDIQSWESRPGVKLVAVDFYADWCKPCKAALPKWDALLQKYHERGLRLIIVTVQSNGRCLNFTPGGWKPDALVCDEEGLLSTQWGAKDLPQGFLFDWHGNKLAEHAEVSRVEAAVEAYFKDEPVVGVDDPKDGNDKPLADGAAIKRAVNTALKGQGKLFSVVADERERARLKAVRARIAKDSSFQEGATCGLGEELPPNSWLTVALTGKPGAKRLGLELYSLSKGCLIGSSYVPVGSDGVEAAAQEAAYALGQSIGKGETRAVAPSVSPLRAGCAMDTDCNAKAIHAATGSGTSIPHTAPVALDPSMDKVARDAQLACVGGDIENCAKLGEMYYANIGVKRNYSEAWRLSQMSCTGEMTAGCNVLGNLYVNGFAVHRNYVEAFHMFMLACKGGNLKGCRNLGTMYETGRGTTKKIAEARRIYSDACKKQDPYACIDYGDTYIDGHLVGDAGAPAAAKPFYKKAAGILSKNCVANDAHACTTLASIYYSSRLDVSSVAVDIVPLFSKGCEGGDAEGCVALADMYEMGSVVPENANEAIRLFKKSCEEGGNAKACYSLGLKYRYGSVSTRPNAVESEINLSEAVRWYKIACENGHSRSCNSLAEMVRDGKGVMQDFAEALRLLTMVSDGWGDDDESIESSYLLLAELYEGRHPPFKKDIPRACSYQKAACEMNPEREKEFACKSVKDSSCQ